VYFIYKVCFFISIKKLKTLEELHHKIHKRIVYVLDIRKKQLLIFVIIIFESHIDKKEVEHTCKLHTNSINFTM